MMFVMVTMVMTMEMAMLMVMRMVMTMVMTMMMMTIVTTVMMMKTMVLINIVTFRPPVPPSQLRATQSRPVSVQQTFAGGKIQYSFISVSHI